MEELKRIGEEEIHPREYYLKKFGYWGKKEFRDDYHIAKTRGVESVVSPYNAFPIE